MKFYNDFSSMFNAQSGVKKDMSVFNAIEKYSVYRQGIEETTFYITDSKSCDVAAVSYCHPNILTEEQIAAGMTYNPFIVVDTAEYEDERFVHLIVREFVRDYPYFDLREVPVGFHLDFQKDGNPENQLALAEELSHRIEAVEARKEQTEVRKYDLTNPIKEKFMMPID